MRLYFIFIFNMVLSLCSSAQGLHLVTVLEYHPAPGQFINMLPKADNTTTHQEICQRCTESLNKNEIVSLGTFGGYITVEFDHPVKNLRGSDFRILGNSFYNSEEKTGGSFEPGIVYVGVGDDLDGANWYRLAGSLYHTSEIHNFSVTYHKPASEEGEHELPYSTFDKYIPFRASWQQDGFPADSTGYHFKNVYHKQSYWPLWEQGDELTFTADRVPNNAIDLSGKGNNYVLYRYSPTAYGYADASLNTDDYSTFDISWAVDRNGTSVYLNQINYIRIVCGIFQHCGWLGETSTEVCGITDLHQTEGYDESPIIISTAGNNGIKETENTHMQKQTRYNLLGQPVSKNMQGLYIEKGKLILVR